jgi:ATP-dependent DNA helicase PIF1
MELSEKQHEAFEKYKKGNNIFISGPAGSGKSALINCIYIDATSKYKNIQVCALTGIASLLLKNCYSKTVHSFSGIALGMGSIEKNVEKVFNNKFKTKIWQNLEILIIDEVSMMSKKLFEMLDSIGKKTRQNSRPFGGIQVIFLGDFYQLPPIENNYELDTGLFCFESDLWFDVFEKKNCIILTKIFRQTDEKYIQVLNEIRNEQMSPESISILKKLVGKKIEEDKIVPYIFPTKRMVEKMNYEEMNKLIDEEEYEYKMKLFNNVKSSNISKQQIENEINYLKKNLLCVETAVFKKGCHVMCIVNYIGNEIVNGSQGVIVGFKHNKMPIVKFNNGVEIPIGYYLWESEEIIGVGISQIPLILSWAVSIHKIQGCSLDSAIIDVGSSIFEFAQTYVALSRVRNIGGLYLQAFDENKIKVNPKVLNFYNNIHDEKLLVT